MSCHCACVGLEELPNCFQSRVPPCHLHDDGCLVLHVFQVEILRHRMLNMNIQTVKASRANLLCKYDNPNRHFSYLFGSCYCFWFAFGRFRSLKLAQPPVLLVRFVSRCPIYWRPALLLSYYGLTVWFPDMIKYLQKQEYNSRTKVFIKQKVEHMTFNFTLENQIHRQGEYFNTK